MKYIISSAIILLLSSGGYAGFKSGSIYQRHVDEKEAISEEVAHYDGRTAEFKWGNLEVSQIAAIDQAPLTPGRKPKP